MNRDWKPISSLSVCYSFGCGTRTRHFAAASFTFSPNPGPASGNSWPFSMVGASKNTSLEPRHNIHMRHDAEPAGEMNSNLGHPHRRHRHLKRLRDRRDLEEGRDAAEPGEIGANRADVAARIIRKNASRELSVLPTASGISTSPASFT